jgi:hypothetical protein
MIAPIGSQYRETIENPSQAIKAARAAASSPHALVNLIRLVGSLDAKSQDNDEAAEAAQPGYADPDVKRDWEVRGALCLLERTGSILPRSCRPRELIAPQSVLYARALLEALEGENEQCVHWASCGTTALIMVIQIVHYIFDPVNFEAHSRYC